jgi:hypothetical protein
MGQGSNPTEPAFDQTHAVFGSSHPLPPAPQADILSPVEIVKLQQHKLWLEKQGYRPKTVRSSVSNLKSLARKCDIDDPESVTVECARRDARAQTIPIIS